MSIDPAFLTATKAFYSPLLRGCKVAEVKKNVLGYIAWWCEMTNTPT
jgi:hypothetical protein